MQNRPDTKEDEVVDDVDHAKPMQVNPEIQEEIDYFSDTDTSEVSDTDSETEKSI